MAWGWRGRSPRSAGGLISARLAHVGDLLGEVRPDQHLDPVRQPEAPEGHERRRAIYIIAEDLEDADEQLQEPPDEERVGRPGGVEGLVDVARVGPTLFFVLNELATNCTTR